MKLKCPSRPLSAVLFPINLFLLLIVVVGFFPSGSVAHVSPSPSLVDEVNEEEEEEDGHRRVKELEEKWGADWGFSGISTFAHLPHVRCLTHPLERFDIAIIGAPFDTAVSYRPGARFGPRAIRAASARQSPYRGFNHRAGLNPYLAPLKLLDCGDIPITPFSSALALKQMTVAYGELLGRKPEHSSLKHPKLVTLGGDHSIALPVLRALNDLYGEPVSVLHFDAHLDTWAPSAYPGSAWDPDGEAQAFNHGSMFWLAGQEALIARNSSVHAGLRTRLGGDDWKDFEDDEKQGWMRIVCDEIDETGVKGIVKKIMEKMGTTKKVYLSVDIDVVDPGLAPGTGTPEAGGWTSRELIAILRGLEDLNIVGADIVEVAPAYDGAGEQTALVASQVVFEILTSMVKHGLSDYLLGDQDTVTSRKDEL